MGIIILLFILAAFIFWLYAEFKLGRGVRIVLGLISILCGAFLVYAMCQIRHDEENSLQQASILVATEALKQGRTNLVISAFETYTSTAPTDSVYRANQRLIDTLYGHIRNRQTLTEGPNTALEPTATAPSLLTNK